MQLFPLGRVVATPAALYELERASINPLELIGLHVSLDPGCLDAEDQAANVTAIEADLRVFSAFTYDGTKYYVITEHDRSVTTLMLASDY
jgi:hypothetical protein